MVVSILTGAETPVQREKIAETEAKTMFQSSPEPRPRCNHHLIRRMLHRNKFQSSPEPRPRCNGFLFSFLSCVLRVSILTGAETPVQLVIACDQQGWETFQSSPEPRPRCNIPIGVTLAEIKMFQSSPEPRPRCNIDFRPVFLWVYRVSILTGAETPVQPPWYQTIWITQKSFNPHRSRDPGATRCAFGPLLVLGVSILTGAETPVQRGGRRL